MYPVSSSIYSAMTGSVVRPALAVALDLETPVYFWTGIGPMVYNGNTYNGVGAAGTVSSNSTDGNLSANGLTLSLSGIPVELMAIAMNEDYQNRLCTLHVLLFNEAGNMIGGNIIFIGRIDVASVSRGPDTCMVTLTVENHMFSLDRVRIRRYTVQDQQSIDPTDIGFEYISKVSQDLSFTWGNKMMTLRPTSWNAYTPTSYNGGVDLNQGNIPDHMYVGHWMP